MISYYDPKGSVNRKMKNIALSTIAGLLSVSAASFSLAQTGSATDCSEATENLSVALEVFRSAYFLRRDAVGSAESVMADEVLPKAEQVYQSCPAQTIAEVRSGVNRVNASLYNPRRAELAECDRALIAYQGALNRYDNGNVSGGYHIYRNLLDRELNPSAQAAVGACPQMTELARQTRLEIVERQRRLDRMEDIENARPTMAESIEANNIIFFEALQDSDNED